MIPALSSRFPAKIGYPDRSRGTASAARSRRAPAGKALVVRGCGRAGLRQKFAGRCGPPVRTARAAFLVHSYRSQIVAGCVAVRRRPAGRARIGALGNLACSLRVGPGLKLGRAAVVTLIALRSISWLPGDPK